VSERAHLSLWVNAESTIVGRIESCRYGSQTLEFFTGTRITTRFSAYRLLMLISRNEPAGALTGLTRVRKFTQDDAHIFCTEDQMYHFLQLCVCFFLIL
jgi:hypothetical protein